MDAYDYLNKRCWANLSLKIESIYIRRMVSLEVKVYEAFVKPLELRKSLLVDEEEEEMRPARVSRATSFFKIIVVVFAFVLMQNNESFGL